MWLKFSLRNISFLKFVKKALKFVHFIQLVRFNLYEEKVVNNGQQKISVTASQAERRSFQAYRQTSPPIDGREGLSLAGTSTLGSLEKLIGKTFQLWTMSTHPWEMHPELKPTNVDLEFNCPTLLKLWLARKPSLGWNSIHLKEANITTMDQAGRQVKVFQL